MNDVKTTFNYAARVVLIGCIARCGGQTEGGTPSAGVPEAGLDVRRDTASLEFDSNLPEAAVDAARSSCPAMAPTPGSDCPVEDMQCEYGDSTSVACNLVMACEARQWTHVTLSGPHCEAARGANGPSCPADFASVPLETSCTGVGLCEYPQGTCFCDAALDGPAPADSGLFGTWSCTPEPGCPAVRPHLGTACLIMNQLCTYAACEYSQRCSGGFWHGFNEAC